DVAREADALHASSMLLGGRLSDQPGSGSAGGLAYCLAALGGRLMPAQSTLVAATETHDSLQRADLAVVVVPAVTPHECDAGLVRAVADHAARRAVPCVAIAGEVSVGARDLMAAGVTSAYPCGPSAKGLEEQVERIAQTWTHG